MRSRSDRISAATCSRSSIEEHSRPSTIGSEPPCWTIGLIINPEFIICGSVCPLLAELKNVGHFVLLRYFDVLSTNSSSDHTRSVTQRDHSRGSFQPSGIAGPGSGSSSLSRQGSGRLTWRPTIMLRVALVAQPRTRRASGSPPPTRSQAVPATEAPRPPDLPTGWLGGRTVRREIPARRDAPPCALC